MLDADALNLISENPKLFEKIENRAVLTPHIVEFSRLSRLLPEDILLDKFTKAKEFAKKISAVIVITSDIDIVTDGEKAYCVYNGDKMMSRITGSGCQLSAMMTAYISANKQNILSAALACVCAMGLCGETAKLRMGESDGNSSYRNYLIDAVYNLTPEDLQKGARYEIK